MYRVATAWIWLAGAQYSSACFLHVGSEDPRLDGTFAGCVQRHVLLGHRRLAFTFFDMSSVDAHAHRLDPLIH